MSGAGKKIDTQRRIDMPKPLRHWHLPHLPDPFSAMAAVTSPSSGISTPARRLFTPLGQWPHTSTATKAVERRPLTFWSVPPGVYVHRARLPSPHLLCGTFNSIRCTPWRALTHLPQNFYAAYVHQCSTHTPLLPHDCTLPCAEHSFSAEPGVIHLQTSVNHLSTTCQPPVNHL